VEVQANAIDTVLRGFPLRSSGLIWNLLLVVTFTLTPVVLNLRLSSLLTGLSSLALAIVFLGGAEFAFGQGVILPFPDPIAGLAISTAGVVAVEGYIERRRRLALETPSASTATGPVSERLYAPPVLPGRRAAAPASPGPPACRDRSTFIWWVVAWGGGLVGRDQAGRLSRPGHGAGRR
jgi:hypothetical protein